MPALGQVACYLQGAGDWPLAEYGTVYGDRKVATYVCIPKKPTPFTIRFMTTGYIAPGLSVWVYVDGVLQCNRNWLDFSPSGRCQTDRPESNDLAITLRQGENHLRDDTFLARSWYFGKINKDVHGRVDPRVDKERIGTVEVVVLRWNNVADSFTGTQASIKVNTNNKTKTQTQEPGAQKSRSKKHVTFAPEESNKGESSGLLDGARGSDSDDHTALWLSQMDGTYESLPMRDKDRASGPATKPWAGERVRNSQPYGPRATAHSHGRILWEEAPTMPTQGMKVGSDRHAKQVGESSNNNHHSRHQGLYDVSSTHRAVNNKSHSNNMPPGQYLDEDLPKVPGHWVADGKHSKSLGDRHPGRHRLGSNYQFSPQAANLSPLQVPHLGAHYHQHYCANCGGFHLVRESGPPGAGRYVGEDSEHARGTAFIDYDEDSSAFPSTCSEEDDEHDRSCSECLKLEHEAAEGSFDQSESWCSECHGSNTQSESGCSCCNLRKEADECFERYGAGPAYSYGPEDRHGSGLRRVYHDRIAKNHGHSDGHTSSHEDEWSCPMLDGNVSKESDSVTRETGRSGHRHSRMRNDYVHICECCGHVCSHGPANRHPTKEKPSSKHVEHKKQGLHMSERRHRGKQAAATKKVSDDQAEHQSKSSKKCDCGLGHEGTIRQSQNTKSSNIKSEQPQRKESRSKPERKHKHDKAEKEGDKRGSKQSHKGASSEIPDERASRKSKSAREQCKCQVESSDSGTEKSNAGNADAAGAWDEGGNKIENWADSAGRDNDGPAAWEDDDGKAKASNLNWDDPKSPTSNTSHASKGKAPAKTETSWEDQAEWDDNRELVSARDQDTLPSARALKKKARTAHVYVADEEPPLRIPRSVADEKDLDHQVLGGKGAIYSHKLRSPRYTDTMEKPYATFKFHYRTREAVDRILGIDATDNYFTKAQAIRAVRDLNMPPQYVRWLLSQQKDTDLDSDSAIDQNEKWVTSKPGDGPGPSKW